MASIKQIALDYPEAPTALCGRRCRLCRHSLKRRIDQVANRPHTVCDPKRHCWRHAQRLVRAAEIIERDVQANGRPPVNGYLFLDTTKFRASFAADVSEEKAAFLADSQVPWGLGALSGSISEPAWKSKPSWYLVATEDKMIPPPAQRQMATRAGATIAEAAGSHAIYISKPEAVAALIAKAAKSVSSKIAA